MSMPRETTNAWTSTILEVDFVGLIYDSSDDEMDPSTYQYISMLFVFTPHMMMQRWLSQIHDSGPYEPEDEKEPKAKKEV